MKLLLISVFIALTGISCNCHYEGSGYVLDQITNKPIEGARVEIASNVPGKDTLSPQLYTDANGYFSYRHDYCKDQVHISKKGYQAHTLHPKGDTIRLQLLEEQQ